jgi:hypothetical protein
MPTNTAPSLRTTIPIRVFGISLSAFLALSFVLCVLLGLVAPGWGMHQPWLQFFPGFVWLTQGSVLLGLAESVAYAWYVALVFGGLFNLVAA